MPKSPFRHNLSVLDQESGFFQSTETHFKPLISRFQAKIVKFWPKLAKIEKSQKISYFYRYLLSIIIS